MADQSPPREIVNTSIRVDSDLLERFREVIVADDPENDVSKEVRRYMRRRVADAQTVAA